MMEDLMVRTGERGSAVAFVVAGLTLVLLLIGGVYLVRHGLPGRPAEIPPVVAQSPAKEASQSNDKKADEPKKSDPAVPAKEPKQSVAQPPVTETQQHAPSVTPASSQSQLPQTGAREMTASIIALGCLTAGMIYYVRSRRALGLF